MEIFSKKLSSDLNDAIEYFQIVNLLYCPAVSKKTGSFACEVSGCVLGQANVSVCVLAFFA
ncbi:hypothetical protein C900_00584 [Fulvivirga imtechensis AK7]|uniref:Uncharacterized protein n=1 Tax=Fulvivirga imtechensis AK7 TaxID=1237149 RepID=L8JHG7_9BACT|nr:hypothetical protein C900_00584 [Fulvivirga imtechensis AK7]